MGSDPASVAFDTLSSAVSNNADVVIIDTAGRLHNKVGLMNELTKIKNVTKNSGCAEGDIKIGFHYEIVTKDNTSSGSNKYIASHAESVISLPKGHMKRNESYLYTLQINLHEIKIEEAKVENWSDITNDVTIE